MRNNLPTIILITLLTSILTIFFVVDKENLKFGQRETWSFYNTKEFTVNIKDASRRYLKTSIALHASQKEVVKELEEKQPVINDRITLYLSDLTVDDLNNEDTKQVIKNDLLEIINGQLDNGRVKEIYYTTFVWQ